MRSSWRSAWALLLVVVAAAAVRADPGKVVVKKDLVYGRVQGAGLVADIAYPEGQA